MITEDYVSYEVAELLCKRGFNNAQCNKLYRVIDKTLLSGENTEQWEHNIAYLCPTLQIAMKWLREMRIFIDIYHYNSKFAPFVWCIFAFNELSPQKANTYEEAEEASIKYVLENWEHINEVLDNYYKNDLVLPKI